MWQVMPKGYSTESNLFELDCRARLRRPFVPVQMVVALPLFMHLNQDKGNDGRGVMCRTQFTKM